MANRFFFILILILFSENSFSQNNDIGKITLSVVVPENIEGLDKSNVYKIETKISQIVSSSGLSSFGYNNNFIIYPKFIITDEKKSENGMENLTFIECEFILVIKQVDNNMVYSTCNLPIKGYGNSKQNAINNAINKILINNEVFSRFIDKGKLRIVEYYNSRCNDLVIQADGMAKRQDYEQAIALLLSIPSEVSCFSKVQNKTIEIYKNYQTFRCGGLLQQARTDAAQNDFNSSLNNLSQIDPASKCGAEAKALIGKIEGKIDIENRQKWQAAMLIYKDAVQLEKQRINAVRDIAVEYARNQPKPPTNNYLLIIR
jgi:hypothetical protein